LSRKGHFPREIVTNDTTTTTKVKETLKSIFRVTTYETNIGIKTFFEINKKSLVGKAIKAKFKENNIIMLIMLIIIIIIMLII
jgi:hypothetical protein